MRLSSEESGAIGSFGSAGESTSISSRRTSKPASFTRPSATTVPVIVTADSSVSVERIRLSALSGSSLASTTWARPDSSRTITNCIRFWSRSDCTQPRILTRRPTSPPSSAISVRATAAHYPSALPRALLLQLHLDRELVGDDWLELMDRAGLGEVVPAQLERVQAPGGVAHEDPAHRRPHRTAGLGLGLANLGEHIRGHRERLLLDGAGVPGNRLAAGAAVARGAGAFGRGAGGQLRGIRPERAVDRAALPPRPHLLGHERQ